MCGSFTVIQGSNTPGLHAGLELEATLQTGVEWAARTADLEVSTTYSYC